MAALTYLLVACSVLVAAAQPAPCPDNDSDMFHKAIDSVLNDFRRYWPNGSPTPAPTPTTTTAPTSDSSSGSTSSAGSVQSRSGGVPSPSPPPSPASSSTGVTDTAWFFIVVSMVGTVVLCVLGGCLYWHCIRGKYKTGPDGTTTVPATGPAATTVQLATASAPATTRQQAANNNDLSTVSLASTVVVVGHGMLPGDEDDEGDSPMPSPKKWAGAPGAAVGCESCPGCRAFAAAAAAATAFVTASGSGGSRSSGSSATLDQPAPSQQDQQQQQQGNLGQVSTGAKAWNEESAADVEQGAGTAGGSSAAATALTATTPVHTSTASGSAAATAPVHTCGLGQLYPSAASAAAGGDDGGQGGAAAQLGTCVVCLSRPSSLVVLPCGHVCLCAACGRIRAVRRQCPVCRVPSTAHTKVFIC